MLRQDAARDLFGPRPGIGTAGLLPPLSSLPVENGRGVVEFGAHVAHCVLFHQIVATRTDLVYHVERQCVVVHLDASHCVHRHAQQLVINHELLVGDGGHILQHTRRVVDEVGPGQRDLDDRLCLLHARLDVRDFGLGHAGAVVDGHFVEVGQLGDGGVAHPQFYRAAQILAAAHVGCGRDGADEDRAAGLRQLGQCQPGQLLGVQLGQHPGHRDRRGRAGHRRGRKHDRHTLPAALDQQRRHASVELERADHPTGDEGDDGALAQWLRAA